MEETSPEFFELFKFLKAIIVYCDSVREVKPRRERIKSLENELEQSINVLQMLNVEQNQLELDLDELRKQHVLSTNEKHSLEAMLHDTLTKLVREIGKILSNFFFFFFCSFERKFIYWSIFVSWVSPFYFNSLSSH